MNSAYGDYGQEVYWEKQGSDRLCGQHCLNSLLQGAFYTEISLSQIAQELDEQEKGLFAQGGFDTKDFHKFMNSPSNNVADDGNYSIQVISEALKRTAELGVESIDSMNAKNAGDLSKETGFICNSSSHWFAIRKVDNKWWNLNSTNREGPEFISDFYLSAFLNSVRENGYTIFVVVGNFPITSSQMFPDLQRHQRWSTINQCMSLHEKNLKRKNYQLNIDGTDERDLNDALERSRKDYESSQNDEFEFENDSNSVSDKFGNISKGETENKAQAFQGQGFALNTQASQGHKEVDQYFQKWEIQNEDPELGFAMLLSAKEEFANRPKSDDDHVTVNFRLPTGTSTSFTFNKLALVETLYDFAKTSLSEDQTYQFIVTMTYPRKQLTNLQSTLEEAGIQDMDSLIVEKQ